MAILKKVVGSQPVRPTTHSRFVYAGVGREIGHTFEKMHSRINDAFRAPVISTTEYLSASELTMMRIGVTEGLGDKERVGIEREIR